MTYVLVYSQRAMHRRKDLTAKINTFPYRTRHAVKRPTASIERAKHVSLQERVEATHIQLYNHPIHYQENQKKMLLASLCHTTVKVL